MDTLSRLSPMQALRLPQSDSPARCWAREQHGPRPKSSWKPNDSPGHAASVKFPSPRPQSRPLSCAAIPAPFSIPDVMDPMYTKVSTPPAAFQLVARASKSDPLLPKSGNMFVSATGMGPTGPALPPYRHTVRGVHTNPSGNLHQEIW